jgi:hypothetical protein
MSHTEDPGLDNPDVAHEHSDVNVRALIGLAIGLFAVTGLVAVLMWGLLAFFQRQAANNDPAVSPLARPAAEMPASQVGNPFFGSAEGPQLLTSEPAVLSKQRAMEAEALGSYGWVDEKSGVARIPISEAKKLILERGLPARAEGTADSDQGTRRAAYGEASAGRTIPTGIAKPQQESTPPEAPAPAAPPKGGH